MKPAYCSYCDADTVPKPTGECSQCGNRTARPQELQALADRVDALRVSDNAVDVLVEIALFKPSPKATAIRANSAGTKVIYTDSDGDETTHWAWDWTHQRLGMSHRRAHTSAALRALATSRSQNEGASS